MTEKTLRPKQPAGLAEAGRRLWNAVTADFFLEPWHIDMLEQACRALDRAETCRVQIEAEGVTVTDRFMQVKPHPLLPAERDARSQFRQFYRELKLDEDEPRPMGRPPEWGA